MRNGTRASIWYDVHNMARQLQLLRTESQVLTFTPLFRLLCYFLSNVWYDLEPKKFAGSLYPPPHSISAPFTQTGDMGKMSWWRRLWWELWTTATACFDLISPSYHVIALSWPLIHDLVNCLFCKLCSNVFLVCFLPHITYNPSVAKVFTFFCGPRWNVFGFLINRAEV